MKSFLFMSVSVSFFSAQLNISVSLVLRNFTDLSKNVVYFLLIFLFFIILRICWACWIWTYWVDIFHQIWKKMSCHYIWNYFFALVSFASLSETTVANMLEMYVSFSDESLIYLLIIATFPSKSFSKYVTVKNFLSAHLPICVTSLFFFLVLGYISWLFICLVIFECMLYIINAILLRVWLTFSSFKECCIWGGGVDG